MKLVSDEGRWALRDNSMIFCNVVWISNEKNAYTYHLIDDDQKEIELKKPITEYIVLEERDLGGE
jgi:hypothetical protein